MPMPPPREPRYEEAIISIGTNSARKRALKLLQLCVGKQIYVHMQIPTHNESEKSAMTHCKASKQVNQGKEEKGQQEAHFYN
jgi:hypothetical protein